MGGVDLNSHRPGLAALLDGREVPHGSKLMRQLQTPSRLSAVQKSALESIIPAYSLLYSRLQKSCGAFPFKNLRDAVAAVDEYMDLLRKPENDVFVRQTDFRTSVIPEFVLFCFNTIITPFRDQLETSGQRDVIIEIMFDHRQERLVVAKTQRVDVAIVRKAALSVNEIALEGFCIPIVVIENKTNFDKNMIGGVEHSVSALKRTFPECLYLALAEWADFSIARQNYANTDIDEIYILRKQKRGEFRRSGVASPLAPELFGSLLDQVFVHVSALGMKKTALPVRMKAGVLIRKNQS